MSVPVLSRSLVACRTALAGTADAFHGLRPRRSDVDPTPCGGRDSASLERQRPLRTTARQTLPLEPILFSKLQIFFCRLLLPTLFYQPEAVHIGDLLRLSVRPDTTITRLPRISSGVESAPDSARSALLLPDRRTLSLADMTPGWQSVKKKDNYSRGPRAAVSEFVCLAASHAPVRERTDPCSGSGILARLPFDRRRSPKTCALPNGTSLSLRID